MWGRPLSSSGCCCQRCGCTRGSCCVRAQTLTAQAKPPSPAHGQASRRWQHPRWRGPCAPGACAGASQVRHASGGASSENICADLGVSRKLERLVKLERLALTSVLQLRASSQFHELELVYLHDRNWEDSARVGGGVYDSWVSSGEILQ